MATVQSSNDIYSDDFNRDLQIDAEVAAAASLEDDRINELYRTIQSSEALTDPRSDEDVVGWNEFNTTMAPFEGQPKYRTVGVSWAPVRSGQYSNHIQIKDPEKKTRFGDQGWMKFSASMGAGSGQKQRQLLIENIADAASLVCYDAQNLADTDHPGKKYDAATKTYSTLTQVNYAPGSAFNETNVALMKQRMTSYHDRYGNHFGNRFVEDVNMPSTNDLRTQAAASAQFHVWAASNIIDSVIDLARTTDNTSKFAGRFSYDKLEELPDGMWAVLWLNTRLPAGTPPAETLPFLRRYDGTAVYNVAVGSETYARHRRCEMHGHSDFGIAPYHWHRFYLATA
jgi:hypothetical protein